VTVLAGRFLCYWIHPFKYNSVNSMMKPEQAVADVELRYGGRFVRVKALVDTGVSRSVISRRLADQLEVLMPLKKPYRLRTADKGELRIIGFCNVNVRFQGVEVPGRARFEVAENMREVDLIIGRPEIDTWGIVFTPEGPKPRKISIEFEII